MSSLKDYSDSRLREYCIYCRDLLYPEHSSRDHVPSKVFLDKPYPENLQIVKVCKSCNESYSKDETYTAAVLGVLMSGSTDPEWQVWDNAARILSSQNILRRELEDGLNRQRLFDFIQPTEIDALIFDSSRLENVLIKNARALALYMITELLYDDPSQIGWRCRSQLTNGQRKFFETIPHESIFPEVGCKMMSTPFFFKRYPESGMTDNGWFEVQPGAFRFAVLWGQPLTVRMVFREFLFAVVKWEQ